jgi:hypothetical protein
MSDPPDAALDEDSREVGAPFQRFRVEAPKFFITNHRAPSMSFNQQTTARWERGGDVSSEHLKPVSLAEVRLFEVLNRTLVAALQ